MTMGFSHSHFQWLYSEMSLYPKREKKCVLLLVQESDPCEFKMKLTLNGTLIIIFTRRLYIIAAKNTNEFSLFFVKRR